MAQALFGGLGGGEVTSSVSKISSGWAAGGQKTAGPNTAPRSTFERNDTKTVGVSAVSRPAPVDLLDLGDDESGPVSRLPPSPPPRTTSTTAVVAREISLLDFNDHATKVSE